MYQVLIVFQVLVGLGIIGLVLMQQGKGADAGAAFGSGASGTVFGARGSASFLSRATAVLAVLFFSTSLGLAIMMGNQDEEKDLMDIPEVEQALPDVPVVSDSSEPVSVPSVSQQQSAEEIPSEETENVGRIPETVEVVEEITEQVEVIEEAVKVEPAQEPADVIQPEVEGQPKEK